jgi:tetratricopeptide (TPR) repeat protein
LVLAAALTTGSAVAAAPVMVVDVGPGLDAERVRSAVGKELEVTPVVPRDPRAPAAAGRLTIEARDQSLTVTFEKSGGAPVRRIVPLSADPVGTAALLAGNVARDEASDLLGALAPKKARTSELQRASLPSGEKLGEATEAWEKGARAYRDALTAIVRVHYETKRREVLAGLDRELSVEKAELERARVTAIQRLEAFVAAHPDAPDGMYRLAALYEERSRADGAPVPLDLSGAIGLYERIIRECPNYREIAAIYYFLGHALNDVGRLDDAQQAWRSLVCHDRFTYPSKAGLPPNVSATAYAEVYPSSCTPVAPASKYVAEAWWQIGNWEFDQLDPSGGPWSYNRAASAYAHGLEYKAAPLYGVTLYKQAWTLFKQQRYELATRSFVKLLLHTDEQEKLTGDRGADFRSEAYTYIAGSLTNHDFKGPDASAPYVLRDDFAEKDLHVAIDRVKDPALIPQDKAWTPEVYRALATEFRGLNQFANAIEVYETMLARWPMAGSAPETQNAIAETYDQLNVMKRDGAIARKALAARTKLASYVGTTPWDDANKDNPAALRSAERLVRSGLYSAAATHTNTGRSLIEEAAHERARQIELLARAEREYELAAAGWQAYVEQDENAPEAYESRYWHADALRHRVMIQAKLREAKAHAGPSTSAIAEATRAAVEVRDSTEDDKFLDNAAFFVVELADVARDLAYARGEVDKRDEVRFAPGVMKDPIPAVVQASLSARDEYARAAPHTKDPARALGYRYYVAETYFLYGHWDVARQRFEAMWKSECGQSPFGFKAWEKLVTMAAKENDAERALALAKAVDPQRGGKSCDRAGEATYTAPLEMEALYVNARRKLEEAQRAKPEDARRLWHETAALYERALEIGPTRDEASEGALNAAYAYKEAGDPGKAIRLYERFIRDYDSGDPKRVARVADAYDALAATYLTLFDYGKAADTYARTAEHPRIDEARRRAAAENALVLFANRGQRKEMLAAQTTLSRLHPTAAESAEAAFHVASSPGVDGLAPFVQANLANPAASRYVVQAAHTVAKAKRASGDKSHRVWFARTLAAWERLRAQDREEAQKTPYVDLAAEAAFTMIDEDIAAKYESLHVYGHRSFDIVGDPTTGSAGAYQRNELEARKWLRLLQTDVIEKFQSLEWVAAAIARQGAIYDTLRTGLYDTTRVSTLSPKAEQLVARLRTSGQGAAADSLEDAARDFWRERKQRELDGADALMIDRYAIAVATARKYNVKTEWTTRALSRLAYYSDLLGDAKIHAYVTAAQLPYEPAMYVRTQPGVASPPPALSPASPLP